MIFHYLVVLTIAYTEAGLDAYFFPNLAAGQPSNNINLSEIEIYLGMMIT